LEEAYRTRFHELSEKIADATHRAGTLLEAELPETEEVITCNRLVAEVAAEYSRLLGEIPEADRAYAERSWGRRVTDLRRLASKLPQKSSGQAARRASDGGFPFLLSREPPKSIEPPRDLVTFKRGEKVTFRVGGEVEAWCGTCSGLTDHHIVAIVDGQPKQVICQACNARHGYRTTPARSKGKAGTEAARPSAPVKQTREEAEAKRKEAERFALYKELAEATDVREFATRQQYRPGQIIQHAEHGRGKVENVLKGSILVRFRDGLKSISTL
jgi:hypothetical protein